MSLSLRAQITAGLFLPYHAVHQIPESPLSKRRQGFKDNIDETSERLRG